MGVMLQAFSPLVGIDLERGKMEMLRRVTLRHGNDELIVTLHLWGRTGGSAKSI